MFKKLFTLFVLASVGGLVAFGAMSSTKVPGTIRNQGAIVRDLVWLKNQLPYRFAGKMLYRLIRRAGEDRGIQAAGPGRRPSDLGSRVGRPVHGLERLRQHARGPHPHRRYREQWTAHHDARRRLLGYPSGVSLDFAFQNWSPVCSANEADRVACIRSVAVHDSVTFWDLPMSRTARTRPAKDRTRGRIPTST